MAISHQHKFVLVHIPKCAGTSMEKHLSKYTELELMNPKLLDDQDIRERKITKTGHIHRLERHLSALEIRNLIGAKKFEEYFKFSFVRNPFARLVSFYNFVLRLKQPDTTKFQVRLVLESSSFKDFIYHSLQEEKMELFFNQYIYIYDDDLRNLMNFTGKVENIQDDFSYVIEKLGLNDLNGKKNIFSRLFPRLYCESPVVLPHKNTSKPTLYRRHYDANLRIRVEKACVRDLEFFGYDF